MNTKILAEVAQGYEGRPDYCALYVKAAAKAGADAIKFQVAFADDIAQPGSQHYDWFKTVEMDVGEWRRIREQASELGIRLVFNLSGERALAIAQQVRPDAISIHATNFFNRDLLRQVLDFGGQVFISTGGIHWHEVEALAGDLADWDVDRDRIVFMYGFQAEPTPVEKSNLMRIANLKQRLGGYRLGYYDHAPGESEDQVNISLMAMTLGADWIEKHLTLSRFLGIKDSVSALEPDEFHAYVTTLRRLAPALGSDVVSLTDEELQYRDKVVKKVLSKGDYPAGHELRAEDLVLKRAAGLPPFAGIHDPGQVVGRRLAVALRADQAILEEYLA